jgi:hypothetical protein
MPAPIRMVLLLMFSISVLAQSHLPPVEHESQLDEVRNRPCDIPIPEGFTCAALFNVGTTPYDGMIANIVGEDVSQISVYLGWTLYTIAYNPPLKRDDKFFHLRRGTHVPVRIDRNNLILQWPDQTRSKGKIIRREAIFPARPKPA